MLQDRRILRVGGTRPVNLDIRIIAATNRDLKTEVEKGNFREDLFFRLNVVSTTLPRLAERREDIPLLVRHFIEKYRLAFRKEVYEMDDQAMTTPINSKSSGRSISAPSWPSTKAVLS